MKTIVRKSDNVSLYLYPDDKEITLESNRTVIGPTDNPELYISDCNASGVNIMTTSAHAAASDSVITFKPSLSAFFTLEEPSLKATTTSFTPLSFRLSA